MRLFITTDFRWPGCQYKTVARSYRQNEVKSQPSVFLGLPLQIPSILEGHSDSPWRPSGRDCCAMPKK
jgi:hypothetical protein